MVVVSTGSTTTTDPATEESCRQNAVVELVVAELVEAPKRPQKKTNEYGGFDRLNHQGGAISEN